MASSPATLYSRLVRDGRLHHEWISPNVERLTGFAPAEVGEDSWWKDPSTPRTWPRPCASRKLFDQGEVRREFRIRRSDGGWRWISDEQRLLRDAEERALPGGRLVVGRLRAARAAVLLAESEERYRLLFEDNPHPMWVFDPDALELPGGQRSRLADSRLQPRGNGRQANRHGLPARRRHPGDPRLRPGSADLDQHALAAPVPPQGRHPGRARDRHPLDPAPRQRGPAGGGDRRQRAAQARDPAAAGPEDGGGRPAGRRRGPRLQQPAWG